VGSPVELFEAIRRGHRREELSIRQHCPAPGPPAARSGKHWSRPSRPRVRRRNGPHRRWTGPGRWSRRCWARTWTPRKQRHTAREVLAPLASHTPSPTEADPSGLRQDVRPTSRHEVWRPLSGWMNVRPRRSGAGSNYPTTCDLKCGTGFPADRCRSPPESPCPLPVHPCWPSLADRPPRATHASIPMASPEAVADAVKDVLTRHRRR
jgi:hypothetical protein